MGGLGGRQCGVKLGCWIRKRDGNRTTVSRQRRLANPTPHRLLGSLAVSLPHVALSLARSLFNPRDQDAEGCILANQIACCHPFVAGLPLWVSPWPMIRCEQVAGWLVYGWFFWSPLVWMEHHERKQPEWHAMRGIFPYSPVVRPVFPFLFVFCFFFCFGSFLLVTAFHDIFQILIPRRGAHVLVYVCGS